MLQWWRDPFPRLGSIKRLTFCFGTPITCMGCSMNLRKTYPVSFGILKPAIFYWMDGNGDAPMFHSSWFSPSPAPPRKKHLRQKYFKNRKRTNQKTKSTSNACSCWHFLKKKSPKRGTSPGPTNLPPILFVPRPLRGWLRRNDFPRYPASKKSREDGENPGIPKAIVCSVFPVGTIVLLRIFN